MEQTKEKFIEQIAKNWDVYYLPSGEINTDVLKAIEEAIDFVSPQADVIKSVCDCGKPISEGYDPCCSLKCWHEKFS